MKINYQLLGSNFFFSQLLFTVLFTNLNNRYIIQYQLVAITTYVNAGSLILIHQIHLDYQKFKLCSWPGVQHTWKLEDSHTAVNTNTDSVMTRSCLEDTCWDKWWRLAWSIWAFLILGTGIINKRAFLIFRKW